MDSITDSMDMNFSRLQNFVMDRTAWHAAIHGVTISQTLLLNGTELKCTKIVKFYIIEYGVSSTEMVIKNLITSE